jgi:hypothetical protein
MHYHLDSKNYLSEERRGRDILPRSLETISGATLSSTTEFLYAAAARNFLKGAKVRDNIERFARASINESLRGSPILSETDVPQLKSAETSEPS